MDKVIIRQLNLETVIGVYEWEKSIKQQLIIDLDMAWDNRLAGTTDNYQHALCYETVSNRIVALVKEKPVELIETVAEMIASCLLNEFDIQWVKVTVMKPTAVKNAASVGVEIERSRLTS